MQCPFKTTHAEAEWQTRRHHPKKLFFMSKKSNPQADIKNANKGTSGTNKTYDKNQGNRGKQLNPLVKQTKPKGK